ncbi:ECF RNA polymerase sigma-E factor [Austwickia sp. TVS 96-490-7B]|uniref:RNA polymerase sigma factor n=1 Tax=Austwickia sp. TVS 96-490-7B TaxID=2830843 RepID=UPI001C5785BE|nr:RNA polymerase sigma factor [Austwickia sp. TVS 96-490-7B]MBW3085816.1 ECF RNA polymerase sigma-E factor [Austwickia sp. TVS 96-490-7B]
MNDVPGGADQHAWFDELFRTTHHQVRRFAARRVPPDQVDDIVAETFASAWQARGREPAPGVPWLYRAAANHVLHAQRSGARRNTLATRIGALPQNQATDPADLVIDGSVAAMFRALSPADGEILRLSVWEELAPREIALVLGCSTTTARVRLHRARRRAAVVMETLATAGPDRPRWTATTVKEPS